MDEKKNEQGGQVGNHVVAAEIYDLRCELVQVQELIEYHFADVKFKQLVHDLLLCVGVYLVLKALCED